MCIYYIHGVYVHVNKWFLNPGTLVTLNGRIYTSNVDDVEADRHISRSVCMHAFISVCIIMSLVSCRLFVGDQVCDPIDAETGDA